jgi:4-hydroxymandelate oxidase
MKDSTRERPVPDTLHARVRAAADYELVASEFLSAAAHAYIAGGSGDDLTVAANRASLNRHALMPRLLCDMTNAHTRVQLPDGDWSHPILLAPVAHQRLMHPEAERASARGAAATDTCMVASTLSSLSLEDIAASSPTRKWFQLYLQPDRSHSLDLVRRAEAAGYSAIVLTADAAIQLPSRRALSAGFRLPDDCVAANLTGYPTPASASGRAGVFEQFRTSRVSADDIDWLLKTTRLPVLVKGVLDADDARQLQSLGVAGVVVSNHGGRTLDGVCTSLTALPAVRAAVGDQFSVLFDSGIRSGTDIFRAIALGADAVLIGRLQAYALAVSGALGVAHLVKLLQQELQVCMAITGCKTLQDIRRARLLPLERAADQSMDFSMLTKQSPTGSRDADHP